MATGNTSIFGNFPLLNNASPTQPQSAQIPPDFWNRLNSILNSPSGQSGIAGLGAALSGYGQGQQQQQNNQVSNNQFNAQLANNQLNSDRSFQLNQAQSAAAADPLGADQNYAQKQKIAQILLGGARNFSVTPGDPAVAAAAGKVSGGLQLPSGGIDASTINNLFGDAATQAAIAQRAKAIGQINPNAPTPDLESMYGKSADGSQNAFVTDIKNSNQQALTAQQAEQARQQKIINDAIDQNHQILSKKPGLLSKILGGATAIAPSVIGAIAAL